LSKLQWNEVGSRFFEAGVDRGVLYVDDRPAVVWTGLISVNETTSGGEARPYYIDGVKYANTAASEEFEASITAYTYPDEFAACDGTAQTLPGLFVTQQRRKSFGLTYRTMVGNDVDGVEHAYKIHIIYNALASPSQKPNATINSETEPTNFTWNVTTRPRSITGYKRTAHIVIDSRYTHPGALAAVEDVLYGADETTPSLPTFEELYALFDMFGDMVVTDNGDGTFTVIAPTTVLSMLDSSTFQITAPTAVEIDEDSYTLSSSS
jgi:hypothetical protein